MKIWPSYGFCAVGLDQTQIRGIPGQSWRRVLFSEQCCRQKRNCADYDRESLYSR